MDSQRRKGLWVLMLTPLLSFVIFESTAGDILKLRGIALAFNLVFFYLFYAAVFMAANSSRMTCICLNTLLTALALGEYYVVNFRYRPIMVWDALSLRTAVSVGAHYRYEITGKVLLAVLASLALSVLAWRYPWRLESRKRRRRAAAGAAAAAGIFLTAFYGGMIDRFGLHVRMWDPAASYREDGYVLSTMVGLSYLKPDVPEGYSPEAAKEIADRTKNDGRDGGRRWSADTDITPTHIICIMNESFSDPGDIRDFPASLPYLDYYRGLKENCVKGKLYVPVFGAMTCNTEFEFLTGNALAFAPEGSVPFQLYMEEPSYSLASVLKDQGYETVAMHPYPAGNWNRDDAYAAMGFDEFLAEDFFEGCGTLRGYVSDRANYEKITEVTESRKGHPLFIFNVTMQNHGGYENKEFEPAVRPLEYEGAPLTEQYLSLMRESDQALRYLIEYYENAEDPTMIVLFGDHRPGVENGFYEYLYGKPFDELDMEEYSELYATPFLIWTNYDTPYEEAEGISAQYLSAYVLERGNLEMSGYHYLLDRMSRTAPVIHFLGYKDAAGQWNSWEDKGGAGEPSVFRDFQIMQYNNLFDRENRCDWFFRAP